MTTSEILKCLRNIKMEITQLENKIAKNEKCQIEQITEPELLTKQEIEYVMSGFGGQDLAGSKKEREATIHESMREFGIQKAVFNKHLPSPKYSRYLKELQEM